MLLSEDLQPNNKNSHSLSVALSFRCHFEKEIVSHQRYPLNISSLELNSQKALLEECQSQLIYKCLPD